MALDRAGTQPRRAGTQGCPSTPAVAAATLTRVATTTAHFVAAATPTRVATVTAHVVSTRLNHTVVPRRTVHISPRTTVFVVTIVVVTTVTVHARQARPPPLHHVAPYGRRQTDPPDLLRGRR